MDSRSMLDTLDRVLERSKIAILATVDPEGRPHMRWMTPGRVRGRNRYLYAVTSPDFRKTSEIRANPSVEWMVQSLGLGEIVTVKGTMRMIDNPSVKAEVLEAIGKHLATFWKLNPDEGKLVVLETAIEEIWYSSPETGARLTTTVEDSDG
jgi:general stress protein 26